MKEKIVSENIKSEVTYEESKLKSFHKSNSGKTSFRIYKGEQVGIHCQIGQIDEEEGFQKAEENLKLRPRPYAFELETGERSRDKTERELTDKELMDTAEECMEYLRTKYPQFIYGATFEQQKQCFYQTNEKGMNYSNADCCVSVYISFKHVDSKDIVDGYFNFSLRDFDKNVFFKMADDFLGAYETKAELPEEIIIDMQYYSLLGKLSESLNGENLALGTSLLSDKIGEKVFSEHFTLMHDVSDEECWFNRFWDGDGCVTENDKRVFVDKGVVLTGYADKKTAKKYNITHTGNAYTDLADIPGPGGVNFRIERSTKTIKELLDGKCCVIPLSMSGGGFADNGDYTMPVHASLLFDGEKVLGKLPPFTIVSSMFDMFGKDFIGVGSDKPIYNDKQILFKVGKGNIL